MIYPEGDAIRERVNNRYSLVVLAAKRAKQIKEGAPVLIETSSTNPLTIALEEIAVGKVTYTEAIEPGADDEAGAKTKSASALGDAGFLAVTSTSASGTEQTSAALPPELAAFLPGDESDEDDEDEPSSDDADDNEGLELLGKA